MSNLPLFFGRLHPLLVHLPIGILILAALLSFWPGVQRRTVRLTWLLGTVAAVAAAGCGWLLAAYGNYGTEVFAHRWWGVATVLLGGAGWWANGRSERLDKVAGGAVLVALSATGHLGGQLTHGDDYLWVHAPGLVQRVVGYTPADSSRLDLAAADADSLRLFATLIRPVLHERCVQCHGAQRANGGLRFDSTHLLFEGGDNGPVLTPGAAMESHLLQRVTLPRSHAKAMPPRGEPLTYAQVRLLAWWIDRGADTLAYVGTANIPEDIRIILRRDYELETRPRTFAERVVVPAFAETTILPELTEHHWRITPLGEGRHAVSAAVAANQTVDGAALALLAEHLAEQVVWLDLSDQPLTAADLSVLSRFTNLNRLQLDGTGVADTTVARLVKLPHLESLNLYHTSVTDAALDALASAAQLRRLYLWRTPTTAAGVDRLSAARPGLSIDRGFRFAPLAASAE